ncbi:sodium channel subunit beta-3-like [Megalops cyprinoides]|uniref:sodium channel subunit beta-3-like n=1 Tax=Megalops cyprinoides TaxID=118141 RepID=UPI001863EE9D|nr:sodium channel subunit beta-3-like [Megalops cyprinoides]XP_036381563.1 sodium channel subunit beta-3-like [Megalops cyprinoides]
MTPQMTLILQSLPLLIFMAQTTQQVCVELVSDTESVEGGTMKLTCIFCKKREELVAETQVDWHYLTPDMEKIQIFHFPEQPNERYKLNDRWRGRLAWNGSSDLQDVSIIISNITLNDTGTYTCTVFRRFHFSLYTTTSSLEKNITLVVMKKAGEDVTAVYSEIMMYVLLAFLSSWLLLAMVYCYRKIARAEARKKDNVCSSKNSSLAGPE